MHTASPPDDGELRSCQRCGGALTDAGKVCRACLETDLAASAGDYFTLLEQPLGGDVAGLGFTVIEELGRGGMGIVYRARQHQPGRDVALKVVQPRPVGTDEIKRRLLAEAQAMAEMNHPGILPLFASGEHAGQPWLAMKLATGGSLAERKGEWMGRPTAAAMLVADLAGAVQHAHERGLIHRDIKPGNVLFDENDHACLADFGLAKWQHRDASHTVTQAMLGTPAYLSPEVARHGAQACTTASDVYGLGALLYELLTGQPPFTGPPGTELLRRIADEEPAPVRMLAPSIPRDLEIVTLKCLAKEPGARYASAGDLAADLRRWLNGEVIVARHAGRAERTWRWMKRHPLSAGLAATVVLLALGSAVAISLQLRALRRSNAALEEASHAAEMSRQAAEDRVAYATEVLPEQLEPIGRLHVLDGVFADINAYYAGAEAPRDAAGLARRAAFLIQWARVQRPQGRAGEAVQHLTEAIALASGVTARPGAPAEAWVALSRAHRYRSETALSQDDAAAAERHAEQARESAAQGLQHFPAHPELTIALATATEQTGSTAHAREAYAAAETACLDAVRQLQQMQLSATWPALPPAQRLRVLRLHSEALISTGMAQQSLKKSAEARSAFSQSLAICRATLVQFPGDSETRDRSAVAMNWLAETLLKASAGNADSDEFRQAGMLYRESEEEWLQLTQLDPANQRWRGSWALSARGMANLEAVRPDPAASRRWLEEMITRFESVPSTALMHTVTARAWACHSLARNLASTGGEESRALALWDKALEISFGLMLRDSVTWSHHAQWIALADDAAKFRAKSKSPGECRTVLQNWLARAEKAAREVPGPWWPRVQSSLHRRLADLAAADPAFAAEAASHNRQALQLRSQQLASSPRPPKTDPVNEVAGAAEQLLRTSSETADRTLVLTLFTESAPHAAAIDPTGAWRTPWITVATRALAHFPRGARRQWIEGLSKAVYPEPPARPWTEAEQKGLALLHDFLSAEDKAASPAPAHE